MKRKNNSTKRISNKRAYHDYELGDSLTVGIALTGAETKALRMGHGQLRGSYVTVKDDELWLLNSTISSTTGISLSESEQTRTRKLLAKRKEIDNLIAAKQQGRTIVPTEMIIQGRFIKLKIAVGRGKKQYDKRQTLKKRDDERNTQRAIKQATNTTNRHE